MKRSKKTAAVDTAAGRLSVSYWPAAEGLIEKVDVLAEIPKVVKAVIAYAAGTKPYIYTVSSWCLVSLLSPC